MGKGRSVPVVATAGKWEEELKHATPDRPRRPRPRPRLIYPPDHPSRPPINSLSLPTDQSLRLPRPRLLARPRPRLRLGAPFSSAACLCSAAPSRLRERGAPRRRSDREPQAKRRGEPVRNRHGSSRRRLRSRRSCGRHVHLRPLVRSCLRISFILLPAPPASRFPWCTCDAVSVMRLIP